METRERGEEDLHHRSGQDAHGDGRFDDRAGLDEAMAEGLDHSTCNKDSQRCADHGPDSSPGGS